MNESVRTYTAFASSGVSGSSQLLSNQEIPGEIRRRCEGVKFVGATQRQKPEYRVLRGHAEVTGLEITTPIPVRP